MSDKRCNARVYDGCHTPAKTRTHAVSSHTSIATGRTETTHTPRTERLDHGIAQIYRATITANDTTRGDRSSSHSQLTNAKRRHAVARPP